MQKCIPLGCSCIFELFPFGFLWTTVHLQGSLSVKHCNQDKEKIRSVSTKQNTMGQKTVPKCILRTPQARFSQNFTNRNNCLIQKKPHCLSGASRQKHQQKHKHTDLQEKAANVLLYI